MNSPDQFRSPVLDYAAAEIRHRRVRLGVISTVLALVAPTVVALAIFARAPSRVIEQVLNGAWYLSIVAFGLGAAGVLRDRSARLAILGSLIAAVEIIFLHY